MTVIIFGVLTCIQLFLHFHSPTFKYANMLDPVLQGFGFDEHTVNVKPFGTGLINHTWKLKSPQGEFILQRINTTVFREPESISHNIRMIAVYLKEHYPDYLFVTPIKTKSGAEYFRKEGDGYYRLLPFVTGSHTETVAGDAIKAQEAAIQFGRFTRLLSDFDERLLKISLPDFHDLGLRYRQFQQALNTGDPDRVRYANAEIKAILKYEYIKEDFEQIKRNPAFKLRVTHHDTKISNVLFNKEGKGICVIDLDTVMPGYFISDVGDMMRTYLSPVSEEETSLDKIQVREEFFKAIVTGYCAEMREELTTVEMEHFVFAGKFMIYMQAIRFLADHLNNDIYYAADYPGHNLLRARNQLVLLDRLVEKETALSAVVAKLTH